MTDPEVAIETVGLSKRYGRRWALSGLDLTAWKGAITAVVGSNGAGKSTLLRLLAGVAAPTSGEVRVLGADPRDERTLSRIGYLDQERPLYKGFRVREMLRFGRELNATWSDKRASSTVEELGIPLDRRIRESPEVNAPRWRWCCASPSSPRCCSSTSLWPTSTRSPARI